MSKVVGNIYRDKANILVIGESCQDVFCYGEAFRLCPEAPAPVFNPVEEISSPGMAMNVRRNVVSLGQKCEIYTNNNWELVKKTRFVHKATNQMFIRVDENDETITRCNVKDIPLGDYDLIIVSDYCKGFLLEEDIKYITEKHSCVFLDTKKRLGKWAESAKFIKINNFEYNNTKHTLTGRLKEKLIVTLGSRGCAYREQIFSVEKVEIKDVSGAGDTFLSALAVEYLKSKDIFSSIEFANQCATRIVQKRGVSIL